MLKDQLITMIERLENELGTILLDDLGPDFIGLARFNELKKLCEQARLTVADAKTRKDKTA